MPTVDADGVTTLQIDQGDANDAARRLVLPIPSICNVIYRLKHWGAPVHLNGEPIMAALLWVSRSFHGVIEGVPSTEELRLRLTDNGRTHDNMRDPTLGIRLFRSRYQHDFLNHLTERPAHQGTPPFVGQPDGATRRSARSHANRLLHLKSPRRGFLLEATTG